MCTTQRGKGATLHSHQQICMQFFLPVERCSAGGKLQSAVSNNNRARDLAPRPRYFTATMHCARRGVKLPWGGGGVNILTSDGG